MRICDLCHGREQVAVYHVSIWRPESQHPSTQEWDLCEECHRHVKDTIQAALHTKRGKAATEGTRPVKRRAKRREASGYV